LINDSKKEERRQNKEERRQKKEERKEDVIINNKWVYILNIGMTFL